MAFLRLPDWRIVIHEKALFLPCAEIGIFHGLPLPRAAVLSAAVYWRAAGARAAGAGPTAGDRPAECGGG